MGGDKLLAPEIPQGYDSKEGRIMRRTKAFSLLLVIILLSGGLRDTSTAAGAPTNKPPIRLVSADLIPPAMTTLAVEGDYAYVGTSRYLVVIDVSDPDNPKQVAYAPLPAPARQVAVAWGRAYVLTDSDESWRYVIRGGDQVQIFDIANPLAPRLVNQLGPGSYGGLAAKNFRLYLLGNGNFSILDTSDAGNPILLGASPSNSQLVSVTGSRAILASDSTFQVMDISDPTNPTILGEINDPKEFSPPYPQYVTVLSVEGDVAAVGGHSIEGYPASNCILIGLTDPSHPTILSSLVHQDGYPSVALAGQRLFFTSRDYHIGMYDISDPSAPIMIDYGVDPVWGLALAGGLVYIAAGPAGFAIYDSQAHDSLERRGGILGINSPEDVVLQGDSLYIADGGSREASFYNDYSDGGLAIAAIHSTEHAEIQGRFENGHGAHLDVEGNQAYLTGGSCFLRYYTCYYGLSILDVAKPEATSLLGRFSTNAYGPVSTNNQIAFLPNQVLPYDLPYGLAILDVSQPVSPTLLSNYYPPDSPKGSSSVTNAIITGTYGLLSIRTGVHPNYSSSLQVIDVSNPISPTLLATYPTTSAGRIYVEGSTGFIGMWDDASSSSVLRVLDISNLPQVQALADIPIPGYIYDLAYDGRYAYFAAGEDGLRVFDLSDLAHPQAVLAYDTPGNAVAVAQEGEWVYLADQEGGLLVFRKVRNFVYMPVVNVTGEP